MKKWILIVLASAVVALTAAADPPWITSLPDALVKAKKENKLVLMNFTGSDWCVGCIQFEKEVFSKPEFLAYAQTNLVLVEVDFPLKKRLSADVQDANDSLAVKYKIEGYPTLIALKPDGAQVWMRHSFLKGGPAALIQQLEEARKK